MVPAADCKPSISASSLPELLQDRGVAEQGLEHDTLLAELPQLGSFQYPAGSERFLSENNLPHYRMSRL